MDEQVETDKLQDKYYRKDLRDKWWRRIKSNYDYLKERFDKEALNYIRAYRHEFEGILPERLLKSDNVDVNLVYPVIKSIVPNLYFKDPKVFVKSLQEKIFKPVTERVTGEMGQEMEMPSLDPATGKPMMKEFDGPKSALIFQSAMNNDIRTAKVKYHAKMALVDALLTYYGAVKRGWGNEQGVASMGVGAPPSVRDEIFNDKPYCIRLKPWDVVVDMVDFNNPEWDGIHYSVHPQQLKADSRLANTEQLKGTSTVDKSTKDKLWRHMIDEDLKRTEYFEIFVKPCALYPNGLFFLITEEIKDDFLFISEWPLEAKESPVDRIYFNPDPEGGLPTPEIRYYIGQQKAKLNLRNSQY